MDSRQGQNQTLFMGLSGEQIAKILYEEFSKTGFRFNNINAMLPPILSRMLLENGWLSGNYITEIFVRGMLGSQGKK